MFSWFHVAHSCEPCGVSEPLFTFWLIDAHSKHSGWGSEWHVTKGYRWEDERMMWTLAHSSRRAARETDKQADTDGGRHREVFRDEGWRTVKTTWTACGLEVEWVWIFIRLYPIGVVWEKGTVWPSSFGSAITADIWICGRADWILSKHPQESYSWWIITSCVPVCNTNSSRRTMTNISSLFSDSVEAFYSRANKLQSEIVQCTFTCGPVTARYCLNSFLILMPMQYFIVPFFQKN